MVTEWVEKVTGSVEQKKRYLKYKARVEQLPEKYRTAIEALNRYLMYFGGITKGDTVVLMLEDLADLFEQSAANGTKVRAIVGENPVEFVEVFLQNYTEGQWISRERERLIKTIDRVAENER